MKSKLYLTRATVLYALLFAFNSLFAQPVLNEIYTTPNGNCNATPRSEFFEIYNGNQGGGNAVANLGCYFLVTRWQNGGGGANNEGFYVIDFPASAATNAGGFFTAAPTLTGATQTQNSFPCEFTASLDWNSGVTTKYTWNGTAYTSAVVTNLTNLFDENAGAMYVFLYNGSSLADALVAGGGGNVSSIMSTIQSWPALAVPVNCLGITSIQNINFAGINQSAIDFVNQNAGSNNGFARKYDGNCGPWDKTSSPPYHTPNASNPGTVANTDTYWNVSYSPVQFVNASLSTVDASLTGIQNVNTITISVYRDINNNGTYDVGIDPQYGATSTVSVSGNTLSIPGIQLPGGTTCFVLLRADNNCYYTQNAFTTSGGSLPVKLKSFTAGKAPNGVSVTWETSFESNVSHFELERKVSGNFVKVASIAATNNAGGSRYSYFDNNSVKSFTLYRLKIIDKDGRAEYSEIRSLNANSSKLSVVISPNPSYGRSVISLSDISDIDAVQVLDVSGRIVSKIPVTSNRVELNNLPKGLYMIKILNSQSLEMNIQKLVVL